MQQNIYIKTPKFGGLVHELRLPMHLAASAYDHRKNRLCHHDWGEDLDAVDTTPRSIMICFLDMAM